MARERGRRRGVRGFLWFLVVLAVLWCGVWYAAGRVAQMGLDHLTAAVSARGGSLSFADQGLGGFPLNVDFHGSDLRLAYTPASVAAGLNRVTAQAPLYRPGWVTADFVSPFVFSAPDRGIAISASWNGASADVDAGLSGLSRAEGSIDGLTLDQTGPRLPIRRVAADHADFVAAPVAGGDYRLTANANAVSVERPDGRTYPPFAGRLDLTALGFGGSLGTDPKRTLQAWARNSGAMRVDRLTLTAGKFSVTGVGDLKLDREGYLSGKLLLTFAGVSDLPDLAEKLKPGSGDKIAKYLPLLTAMSKPGAAGDTPQVPLLINKGAVFLSVFPIFAIPPVNLAS
jgi:hypothetical protein